MLHYQSTPGPTVRVLLRFGIALRVTFLVLHCDRDSRCCAGILLPGSAECLQFTVQDVSHRIDNIPDKFRRVQSWHKPPSPPFRVRLSRPVACGTPLTPAPNPTPGAATLQFSLAHSYALYFRHAREEGICTTNPHACCPTPYALHCAIRLASNPITEEQRTMVSFSCEACGDVLTKKKLDGHRNQCRSAVFTCLDCQKTFHGVEYRAHTSCISEDQKYQGALYKEKPTKASKRKSVAILEPSDQNALVRHQAYVEDEDDLQHPPHVPTPPPAVPNNRDSVFDYMIDEDQPNTPRISFTKAREREEMSMKHGAPTVFTDSRASSRSGYRNNEERINSQDYEEHGFSYGTEPINPRPYSNPNTSFASLDFMTPAAKATKLRLEGKERPTPGHSRTNSGSEKKRKRGDADANGINPDTPMTDVGSQIVTVDNTPAIHSGLTGGLGRMMSDESRAFPRPESPSNDDHERRRDRGREERRSKEHYEEPASPLKRSRYSKDDPGLGISIKGRAVKALSMVGGALLPVPQQDGSKTRRRASSSEHENQLSRMREGEKRERKKHKVTRHNGTASSNIRHDHNRTRRRGSDNSPDAQRQKLKAIEYRKHSESGSDSEEDNKKNGTAQVVIFGAADRQKRRCKSFLSNIPGTESEKGYSVHKALKRWHKQNDMKSNSSKAEEEQELWRGLRLKMNDRGEIVVTFG